MSERTGTGAERKRGSAWNAALLIGIVAGLWDAIWILTQNPASFSGPASAAAFVGAAVASTLILAAAAGTAAAWLRLPPAAVIGAGASAWLFLWTGVQIHVSFFFGKPLLSTGQLAAQGLVLGCAAGIGAGLARIVAGRVPAGRGLPVLSGALLAGCVLAAAIGAPRVVLDAARGPADPTAQDLLLITLDTTRADHLSCYGYPRGTTPAIDRLARRGRTLAGAYSPIPLTNPSHCSFFTGLEPRDHGVLNNGTALPASVPTFVPELARRGYTCAAFVSGLPLKALLSGLAPGFHEYDDAFGPLERVHPMMTSLALVRVANRVLPVDFIERRSRDTARAAIRWLRDAERPRFLWTHFFDPHTPYDAPKELVLRFRKESPRLTAHSRPATEWPVADYDAELREMDRRVGEVARAFHEASDGKGGICLVADHGEGLLQHGELAHGTQLYEEDLRVPLILAGIDGAEPGAVDVTSPSAAWSVVHASLAPLSSEPSPSGGELTAETFAPEGKQDQTAWWGDGGAKLLVNWDEGTEIRFDLDADPRELSPAPAEGPQWQEVRRGLAGRRSNAGRPGKPDPETLRRLRTLGYIH